MCSFWALDTVGPGLTVTMLWVKQGCGTLPFSAKGERPGYKVQAKLYPKHKNDKEEISMGYSTGIQSLGLLRHTLPLTCQLRTCCPGLDSWHSLALPRSTHPQTLIFGGDLARTLWSPG